MVASPFPWFGQSRRNDPRPRAALSVGDGEHPVLDHAEQDVAILAVVLTLVLARHGKGSSKARRAMSKLTP
jgi:hypothetical protein